MNLEDTKLKAFFDLSDEEKEMVLSWRNDKNVRKWMHNSDLILKKNHFNFIENLRTDVNNRYFLVQEKNENIGVIYFNNINKKKKICEFGVYANTKLRGVGKKLLNIILNYCYEDMKIETLYAEVYQNNEKAISLYKKVGFKNNNTEIKNQKKIICMRLNNENR